MKSFGSFKIPKIEHEAVSETQYLIEEIGQIKTMLRRQLVEMNPVYPIGAFIRKSANVDLRLSEGGPEIEVSVRLKGERLARLIGATKAMSGVMRVVDVVESKEGSEFTVLATHDSYAEVMQNIEKTAGIIASGPHQ